MASPRVEAALPLRLCVRRSHRPLAFSLLCLRLGGALFARLLLGGLDVDTGALQGRAGIVALAGDVPQGGLHLGQFPAGLPPLLLRPVAFQLGGVCPFRLCGSPALGPVGPLLKRQRPPGPGRIRLADRREATAAQFPAIRPPEGS